MTEVLLWLLLPSVIQFISVHLSLNAVSRWLWKYVHLQLHCLVLSIKFSVWFPKWLQALHHCYSTHTLWCIVFVCLILSQMPYPISFGPLAALRVPLPLLVFVWLCSHLLLVLCQLLNCCLAVCLWFPFLLHLSFFKISCGVSPGLSLHLCQPLQHPGLFCQFPFQGTLQGILWTLLIYCLLVLVVVVVVSIISLEP